MLDDATLRAYRDALYESLAGGETAARDADPVVILSRLTVSLPAAADPTAAAGLDALRTVAATTSLEAAVERAAERFESPAALREAVYFARCLARDAASALSLLDERRYLEQTVVPTSMPELATDRSAVLDASTFGALWREPGRLDWMLGTARIWRREYLAAYATRHAAYHAALATIADRVDGLADTAAALERLNGLARLGPPLAVGAIEQYRALERLYPCAVSSDRLAALLEGAPACPDCAFALGDEPPAAETRRVLQAVERGLTGQQNRLARRVVSRILERTPSGSDDDRVGRFVQVVQASDLRGLAGVLDDAMIAFLRRLLDGASARSDDGVLDQLVRLHPEVTPASLEAAVADFRRLLESRLVAPCDRLSLRSEAEARG